MVLFRSTSFISEPWCLSYADFLSLHLKFCYSSATFSFGLLVIESWNELLSFYSVPTFFYGRRTWEDKADVLSVFKKKTKVFH